VLHENEPTGELDLLVKVLDSLPASVGADLRNDVPPTAPCGPAPVQFIDVFPNTLDGKVNLFPPELDAEAPLGLYAFQPDPGTAKYPLALISPTSDRTINSTLGQLPRPDVKLLMHPDDAQVRGLADGDFVRIFNDLGEVHCPLQVAPAIRPGTVSMPKGLWRRSVRSNTTTTALVPDTLTDIAGGACFNDARVQVASLPNA
jgi:anaerobic selenocysteine-containing dehydrogenase